MATDAGSGDALVIVGSYTQFDNLAHTPSGTEAKYGFHILRLNEKSHSLTLLSVQDGVCNPAFLRVHPTKNIVYALTESINEDGQVVTLSVSPLTGKLRVLGSQSAAGKSTCYISLDIAAKRALCVNYWDSTLAVLNVGDNGVIKEKPCFVRQPSKEVKAKQREDHLRDRQSEPHAHAVVLDPCVGRVAYVPDLGEDCIKQYVYDPEAGTLTSAGKVPAHHIPGPHGPRYIEFHPVLAVAYVVNEISSDVAVFAMDESLVSEIQPGDDTPTLTCMQHIPTVPVGFPAKLNTCGRVTVDPTGGYVLVSNRGHNSLAVLRIHPTLGTLSNVDYVHTRGRTPRHFQFNPSGTCLVVANQDTDEICVFRFDALTGQLTFTCEVFDVPSPSFVLVFRPHGRDAGKADKQALCTTREQTHLVAELERLRAENVLLKQQLAKSEGTKPHCC